MFQPSVAHRFKISEWSCYIDAAKMCKWHIKATWSRNDCIESSIYLSDASLETISNVNSVIVSRLFGLHDHLKNCEVWRSYLHSIFVSRVCVDFKGTHQVCFKVSIDFSTGFLDLIIKPFDHQTDIFRELCLIIKPFDNQAFWEIWLIILIIKLFDYFVYKPFPHKPNKPD